MAENIGRVIQVAGPAVDVQFTETGLPPIYQALRVVSEGFNVPDPINVILEVEQHLGEGRLRCVAMQPTDGMVRGMKVIDPGRADLGAGGPRDAGAGDQRDRRAGGQVGAGGAQGQDSRFTGRRRL